MFTLGYPAESEAYKSNGQTSTVPYRPTNVAIAPNGDIYVGDGYGSSFVNHYNQRAEFIGTFGGLGKGATSWIARMACGLTYAETLHYLW